RRVQQHVIARAGRAGEIGLEAEDASGLTGRAHQMEGAAGEPRTLARQVGGAVGPPCRKRPLERRNRIVDADEAADVGLGEIERLRHQMLIERALSSMALRSNLLMSSIRSLVKTEPTSFTWPSRPAKCTCASHSSLLMAPKRLSLCHGPGNHLSLRESTIFFASVNASWSVFPFGFDSG